MKITTHVSKRFEEIDSTLLNNDVFFTQQLYQTSNRIPLTKETSGEMSELDITKPPSMNRSQRPTVPKAETHPPGQPAGQSNPCITASPCPEKPPTGEITTLMSYQIQQRHPWTGSSNGSIPSPKQPNRPKTTQSDLHTSRKHSASTSSHSSSSGTSFPRQIKNLKTFKETPASKKE